MAPEEEFNIWKVLTLVFAVIAVVLVLSMAIQGGKYYDFGNGFRLKKSTVNDISKAMDNEPFRICSIHSEDCLTIGKIGE